MSFLNELKRRNVIRVGIAYLASTWLLIQVLETLLPIFDLPATSVRVVVIVLAIGFVPVTVFAWVFELTPEGLKRDAGIDLAVPTSGRVNKHLDRAIMVVLALALGYFAFDKFVLDPARDLEMIGEATAQARADALTESFGDHSIAVLAFSDMSPEGDQEYLSDGIAEELLNLLAKIPELRVVSRSSAFSFKGQDIDIPTVAKQLNVAYVLEGSVQKSGNRIRISAKLIEARTDTHMWSKTYNRTLDDIFAIQDEISSDVVEQLKVTLLGTMPEVRKTDPEVYSLYLQAGYILRIGSVENLEKAVAVLKQALAIDPDYAPAWVRLDWAYESLMYASQTAREEYRAPRIEAIERALAIDENHAYAWAALAYQRMFYDSDWHGARIAIENALRLDPNDADIIGAAAWLASATGRLPEAIELLKKAVSLDPLNPYNLRFLGQCYMRVGRIDEAFDKFDWVRALNPDYFGLNSDFSEIYMMRGDLENALLEIEKSPDLFFYRIQKATILFMMGKEAEAQILINELLETTADDAPGLMATVYAWRGEGDSAFEWLERAYEQDNVYSDEFLGSMYWRKLTGDARYSAYVEKIGLLEEWKAMPPEYGGPPAQ